MERVRDSTSSLNLKLPSKAASALEYPDALLDMFRKLLDALREGSDWGKESQKVYIVPGKNGISQTDMIFVYSDDWDAVFDMAKGAVCRGVYFGRCLPQDPAVLGIATEAHGFSRIERGG